jgi:hypothetical protein
MADLPLTFDAWSRLQTLPTLARVVLTTLIENRPLLGMMPGVRWPGGDRFTWTMNSSLPTITWTNETATLEATRSAEYNLGVELSQAVGDVELPIHLNTTMDSIRSPEVENTLNLIRSMGIALSGGIVQGTYIKEADVTIRAEAGTKGIDAVVAVGGAVGRGFGSLKFTDADDKVYFRAPGSRTYGAGVVIAGASANYVLADGENTSANVTLTIDSVDSLGNGDWEYHEALSFPRPEQIAGIKELATIDSNQVFAPVGADGDALTLAHLDELEEATLGPKSELIYLTNARTRRHIKSLIAAVGGTTPSDLQTMAVNKYGLAYEGVGIVADPSIDITETQGATTTATRVYCARLNPEVGWHLFWGMHSGPNFGTMSAVSDHDAEGGPITLPVYMRKLGESYNGANYKWRISAAVCSRLAHSKSMAVRYGITS